MATKLRITRDQLAKFLGSHEEIRQFERLLSAGQEINDGEVLEALLVGGNANATAINNASEIAKLRDDFGNEIAGTQSRYDQLQALLADLRSEVEDLESAPQPYQLKRARFGSFYDTSNQQAQIINTAYPANFNTTNVTEGLAVIPTTASFTATISNGGAAAGFILDVTAISAGEISIGQVLTGAGVTIGTRVVAFGTGTGGVGTYTVDISQAVLGPVAMTATKSSRIYADTEGVYQLIISTQLDKTGGGAGLFDLWLRKNDVNVAFTAGRVRLAAVGSEIFTSTAFYVELASNEFVEFMYSVDDTTIRLLSSAAAAPRPGIPSINVNATNNVRGLQ